MLAQIQREIAQDPYYNDHFDNDGQRFIAWYLRRVLLRDDAQTRDNITDGANDKEIDAVIVDEEEQRIVVIQGKFITTGQVDGRPVQEVLTAWPRLQKLDALQKDCNERLKKKIEANAMQNALMVAQTAGKVFSPQNWLKSGSSWQGETLAAGMQAGMLSGFQTGPALIERMKAPSNAFEKRWSAE